MLVCWCSGKESICQGRRLRRCRFDPSVRKIPWRRKWQPTPGFLPGKFHGQRRLVGYCPWGHRESDMTQHTCTHGVGLGFSGSRIQWLKLWNLKLSRDDKGVSELGWLLVGLDLFLSTLCPTLTWHWLRRKGQDWVTTQTQGCKLTPRQTSLASCLEFSLSLQPCLTQGEDIREPSPGLWEAPGRIKSGSQVPAVYTVRHSAKPLTSLGSLSSLNNPLVQRPTSPFIRQGHWGSERSGHLSRTPRKNEAELGFMSGSSCFQSPSLCNIYWVTEHSFRAWVNQYMYIVANRHNRSYSLPADFLGGQRGCVLSVVWLFDWLYRL